jgi:hypothetical protein
MPTADASTSVQHGEDHVERQPGHGHRCIPVAGARAAVDEYERVVAGARRQDDIATGARPRSVAAHLIDDLGRRGGRRRPVGQQPAAILLDPDRGRFVASPIEVCEHSRR